MVGIVISLIIILAVMQGGVDEKSNSETRWPMRNKYPYDKGWKMEQ